MTTVSIIGNGNMGSAIGGIVAAAGHTVEYVNRDTAEINGDIVVLAVAHPSVAEILETRGEQLEQLYAIAGAVLTRLDPEMRLTATSCQFSEGPILAHAG